MNNINSMKKFSIIVAVCNNYGIGKNGKLPWKNKEDMKYFRDKTVETNNTINENAIIMGRNTFESMNRRFLPNRKSIVITSQNIDDEVETCNSLDDALHKCNKDNIENVFVIGGEMLYKHAIEHPNCESIYLNKIDENYDCDTHFPNIDMDMYEKVFEKPLSNIVTNIFYRRI